MGARLWGLVRKSCWAHFRDLGGNLVGPSAMWRRRCISTSIPGAELEQDPESLKIAKLLHERYEGYQSCH
jgi:hypothetical protein